MLVDNCVFKSDGEGVVAIGRSLARACGDKAVEGPGFEDGVELRAAVFGPDSVDDACKGEDAVV